MGGVEGGIHRSVCALVGTSKKNAVLCSTGEWSGAWAERLGWQAHTQGDLHCHRPRGLWACPWAGDHIAFYFMEIIVSPISHFLPKVTCLCYKGVAFTPLPLYVKQQK